MFKEEIADLLQTILDYDKFSVSENGKLLKVKKHSMKNGSEG